MDTGLPWAVPDPVCGEPSHGELDAFVPGRAPGPPGDPRVDRTRLHPLTDILVLSVRAVICGADRFVAIALFGQLNEAWRRTFRALPHGIPSHDTLGRVLARLDAARFEEGFRDWGQGVFALTDGQVVPLDGQSVRGSHDRGRGLAPLPPDRCLGTGQPAGAGPDDRSRPLPRDHGYAGTAAQAVPGGLHRDLGCDGLPEEDCAPNPDAGSRLRAARPGAPPGSPRAPGGHVGSGTTGAPAYLAHVEPDRAWCGLASRVRVESERRGGDRVATDTRCFIPACPPRPNPCCRRYAGMGGDPLGAKTPPLGLGRGLRRGRQSHPHGPRGSQYGHPRRIAHNLLRQDRSLKVGIAHKRLAAAWNKDCLCRLIGLKSQPVWMQSPWPCLGWAFNLVDIGSGPALGNDNPGAGDTGSNGVRVRPGFPISNSFVVASLQQRRDGP